MAIIYSKHAKEMLKLRGINQTLVKQCANYPDYIIPSRENRKIYLKDFEINFLKLIIAEEDDNKIIITGHWIAKERIKQ